jgi:hypothetical protein
MAQSVEVELTASLIDEDAADADARSARPQHRRLSHFRRLFLRRGGGASRRPSIASASVLSLCRRLLNGADNRFDDCRRDRRLRARGQAQRSRSIFGRRAIGGQTHVADPRSARRTFDTARISPMRSPPRIRTSSGPGDGRLTFSRQLDFAAPSGDTD